MTSSKVLKVASQNITNNSKTSSIIYNPDANKSRTVDWKDSTSYTTQAETNFTPGSGRIEFTHMGAQFKGDINEAKCSFAQKDFEADIAGLERKK